MFVDISIVTEPAKSANHFVNARKILHSLSAIRAEVPEMGQAVSSKNPIAFKIYSYFIAVPKLEAKERGKWRPGYTLCD